jgi:peptidyl-prolyl cis-trans isomerase SurA
MKMASETVSLKFINSLLLAGCLLAVNTEILAQSENGFVVDKIIAKVDNYVVLKSELEGSYQNYLAEGNPPSEEARCALYGRLIVNLSLIHI